MNTFWKNKKKSLINNWSCIHYIFRDCLVVRTSLCARSVTQSCLTRCDPIDCSPPGSSVRGILQARTLEGVTLPSPRGSSRHRGWTCVSCIGGWILYHWATWEAPRWLKIMGVYSQSAGLVPRGDSEREYAHASVPASGGCGSPGLVDHHSISGSVFPWASSLCFLKSPSAFSLLRTPVNALGAHLQSMVISSGDP